MKEFFLGSFNEMFSIQLLVVITAKERVTREVLFVNGYMYVGLMPLKITKMSQLRRRIILPIARDFVVSAAFI